MNSKFFLIFFLNFFLFNISFANNIAFIDLNFIINNSNVGKKVIEKLESTNNKNLDLLKKEQKLLNDERDEIEKTKNILSQEELNNKILSLNNKLQNFKKKQDSMSKQFQEFKQNEMSLLMNKINPIIEKYMIENNIDLMLKKENVYISKTEYDASNKIINLINNNFSN
jgi:outer membrane protein